MDGSKGVPDGKVGEVLEVRGLVNFPVEAKVVAIGVVEERGHLENAVKSGVENGPLLLRAALDFDQGEFFFPSLLCLRPNLVEIFGAGLGFQIGPGVFDAYVGNSQLESDGLGLIGPWKLDINTDR